MKTITVFTPTYNRAHLLPQLYKSLCSQSSKDFLWLVIDDGSSDGTEQLIQKWQFENKIEIQYQYKENGGMHTGHNMAISLIVTDLCVCIDSDDYLANESISIILSLIGKHNILEDSRFAGIIGLNYTKNGRVIGNKFPTNNLRSKYQDISFKHKAIGDKKVIYKSEILKSLEPYPEFPPEKFVPLYHPILMDDSFDFLCFNEIFCIVEYQNDGSTINIYNQYFANPKGFRYARKIEMQHYSIFKRKFTSAVHQISSNIILKELNLVKGSPNLGISLMAIPFGILWYLYIFKNKNLKRNIENYTK